MIRYSLRCERGHDFESWFQNSSAYDSQHKRGLVSCPMCESTKVEKAIMAPRIARKGKSKSAPEPVVAAPAEDTAPASLVMAPQEREFLSKLRELRDHVLKNADDVGNKFPEEARKMHYGDIEQRAIYGEATADEARSLVDEGIEVAALPVLPGDRN